MEDARRAFNAVVVTGRPIRRSRLDSLLAKQRLKQAGVTLHNVTEPFDDTPAGLIGQGMLELIAEWYSRDLQHKVTAGLRKRAEKGLPNAMPPFGYQQSLTPTADPPSVIPEEAAAVREAFELFAMGTHSYREIAGIFNQRGFRTRHPRAEERS
jgi:DNA invertase Pin-like site-specific DNA recombinase